MSLFRSATLAAAFGMASILSVKADDYPSKFVTIVVPLVAGTGMDSIARLYADKLRDSLGRPVIVENRPGASTMLGTSAVAKAVPDGHTLLVATNGAMVLHPVVFKHVAYDAEHDFIPISMYAKSPFILIANPSLPVRSVSDLITYAKQKQSWLTYSSTGIGSPQHLAMEMLKQRFNIKMTHIPYRDTGQALMDIAGGNVDCGFAEAGASVPLIRDGRVRALAVSASTHLNIVPEIPPLGEAVDAPDLEMVGWHVLFAPSGTPKQVVERLHTTMKQIMAAAEMKQRIETIGLIPVDTPSSDAVADFIASERKKWTPLVRSLGLEGSQ